MKEIRNLKKMNVSSANSEKIQINFILTGTIDHTSSITNISNIITSLRNDRFINEKYILDVPVFYYVGTKNDLLIKLLQIDHHIEYDPNEQRKKYDITNISNNLKYYNLIQNDIFFDSRNSLK